MLMLASLLLSLASIAPPIDTAGAVAEVECTTGRHYTGHRVRFWGDPIPSPASSRISAGNYQILVNYNTMREASCAIA